MIMKKKCLILLIIILSILGICNFVYAKYVLTREINMIGNSEPFYFNAQLKTSEDITVEGDTFDIDLTIMNYENTECNSFETRYGISMGADEKFEIVSIHKLNSENNDDGVDDGVIAANTSTSKTVRVTLQKKEGKTFNEEETVILDVSSTEPYTKKVSISVDVDVKETEEAKELTFTVSPKQQDKQGYKVNDKAEVYVNGVSTGTKGAQTVTIKMNEEYNITAKEGKKVAVVTINVQNLEDIADKYDDKSGTYLLDLIMKDATSVTLNPSDVTTTGSVTNADLATKVNGTDKDKAATGTGDSSLTWNFAGLDSLPENAIIVSISAKCRIGATDNSIVTVDLSTDSASYYNSKIVGKIDEKKDNTFNLTAIPNISELKNGIKLSVSGASQNANAITMKWCYATIQVDYVVSE